MKNIVVIIVFLIFNNLFSQDGFFTVYENGLIYPESTITSFKKVIDSLNNKFTFDANKNFNSLGQCKADFIHLENQNVLQAKKDLENNISYWDLISKYPNTIQKKNVLIINKEGIKYIEIADKHSTATVYLGVKSTYDYTSLPNSNFIGKWIYKYTPKSEYQNESLEAFYFKEEFLQKQLPPKYSKIIQYPDFLIDTAAVYKINKFKKRNESITKKSDVVLFLDYVNDKTKKPFYDAEKYTAFEDDTSKEGFAKYEKFLKEEYEKYQQWDSLRFKKIDSLFIKDALFVEKFNDAINEVLLFKISDDEFDEYVSRYHSKQLELELKRNRRYPMFCGNDIRAIRHAYRIAMLISETEKWDIFLRSHLELIDYSNAVLRNDPNISSLTKVLEVLDINTIDLFLGVTFSVENPTKNHYEEFSAATARSLSQSINRVAIENSLVEMIADKSLDDYNRVLLFNLYVDVVKLQYNKNLQKRKLKKVVSKLPIYISSKIKI